MFLPLKPENQKANKQIQDPFPFHRTLKRILELVFSAFTTLKFEPSKNSNITHTIIVHKALDIDPTCIPNWIPAPPKAKAGL